MNLPEKKSEEANADAKVVILFLFLVMYVCSPAGSHNLYGNHCYNPGDDHMEAAGLPAKPASTDSTIIYAWQEYGVTPGDTVWFDDFLVVGADTLSYSQVYGRDHYAENNGYDYAWQEYGVSPGDTVWFDDFLVVGADTLSYSQAYGGEHDYYADENGNVPKSFNWSARLPGFHLSIGTSSSLLYYDFYLDNIGGILFNDFTVFYPEFISPADSDRGVILSREGRPLYSYYMGRPVNFRGIDRRRDQVISRQAEVNIQIPVVSALLRMLTR